MCGWDWPTPRYEKPASACALREPLETGEVRLARAGHRATYPARFMLVAAMNPCPCGYHGSPRCQCSPERVARYTSKISGPLLDRMDMVLHLQPVPHQQLLQTPPPAANNPARAVQ
ncbi:MAG: ATP-binding protein, partial [Burkholderiaceae bacterium]